MTTPNALGTFQQLDHQRRAIDHVIRSGISSGECAKPVTGKTHTLREEQCSERSLSREASNGDRFV